MTTQTKQVRCRICRGRGYTFEEDAQGNPIKQVTCSYCGGDGTNDWVEKRFAEDDASNLRQWSRRRYLAIALAVFLWVTLNTPVWSFSPSARTMPNPWVYMLHVALVIYEVWLIWWIVKHRPGRKPDPFKTDTERKWMQGANFGLWAGLMWKSYHHRK